MNSITFGFRIRQLAITLSLFFLFTVLVVQFYFLQIIQGDIWEKRGEHQHKTVVYETFKRGKFFSNTSIRPGFIDDFSFVIDRPLFYLNVDPEFIPEKFKETIAKNLQNLLNVDEEKREFFYKQLSIKSRYRKLFSDITIVQHEDIQMWWKTFAKINKIPINAIFFEKDYMRSYPGKHLLGQVLHTVRKYKDPNSKQKIPTGGLEESLQNFLVGSMGKRSIIRSVRQNHIGIGEEVIPPKDGSNVYLTINHHLQAIAEEELKRGVDFAEAKSGWAIMMDPHSGEILLLAQYPFFDPENYEDYYNDKGKVDFTRVKGVVDSYEPGSVMKPVTLMICLYANEELEKNGMDPIFSPEEKLSTSNGYFRGRSKVINEYNGKNYLYLNMYQALQRSSNIYMARLVERVIEKLGDKWYYDALYNMFKLGHKTGIELNAEDPGKVPQIGKYHHNGHPEWSKDTPYSLAMGHNITVNSIQLLVAYSIIANGGKLVKPTLIKKIVNEEEGGKEAIVVDNTTEDYKNEFMQVVSKKITTTVMEAMRYMSLHGKHSNIYGYTEASKSGTAPKIVNGVYSKSKYFSSFVTIAPAENPRFVLLVSLDEPSTKFIPGEGKLMYGGTCAAPIATAIAKRSLRYLGITSDDPYGYHREDPRSAGGKAKWQEKLDALNALYKQWNHVE